MKRREFLQHSAVLGTAALIAPGCTMRSTAMPASSSGALRLDTGWRFTTGDVAGAAAPTFDDNGWAQVVLPHTARIEALVTGLPGTDTYQWQGVAWYRRQISVEPDTEGRKVYLQFDAAMNVADVFLDGERIAEHMGGFLPFVMDVTDRVSPGRQHTLAVRLDNTDNPITGPKPLAILDFNTYGGLYRHVHLIVRDRLHITDPILTDRPASGGVFFRYPEVSAQSAIVRAQTHVRNEHGTARAFRVHTALFDSEGALVLDAPSEPRTLESGAETDVVQRLDVREPRLWSPRDPYLYTVRTRVVVDGDVVDEERTRIGIRHIRIDDAGFTINGERMYLRGTNRHQEHPYIGYAVPDAAHYRDARRIKDAGFDYIRLSHYPHSPAFMDACDELGLVVMNCIPGWQYFGEDPAFAELQYRNTRELVRRDRNHPCVVLWEVSLNETAMPATFVERTHAIAHEEYPGDQMYTCGWVPGYDVFIRARQHGGCEGVQDAPCIVSEYGDWEYYAMTAGLNQEAFQSLSADEQNSRQLRWHGERAQLQQATNFQEAHNDNRAGAAFGDGLWVMFDYNRGYAPDIESSGCMDIFRLPKYSYWFFRSQRPADEGPAVAGAGPMVFIASEWTATSSRDVRVFSNCDEVELRLNGRTVARSGPDRDRISTDLLHPPFTFDLGTFRPGALEAIGYRSGAEAARHVVRSPGPIERLRLTVAAAGRAPTTTARDTLFLHAALQDAAGTTVAAAWENVAFGVTGDARLIGTNPFSSDAGIATILVDTPPGAESASLYALSIVRQDDVVRVVSAAAPLLGQAATHEVRYTTDGSAPGAGATRYETPVRDARRLRAALFVGGRAVAQLDEATPKFRIRGSSAPGQREPFRH